MNDPRQGCVAVNVVPNAAGNDFTVAAARHCIAPTGCWWPKCSCGPAGERDGARRCWEHPGYDTAGGCPRCKAGA